MEVSRRIAAISVSLVLTAGGGVAIAAPRAVGSVSAARGASGCDAGQPIDYYRLVDGRGRNASSFVYAKRRVFLMNGAHRNYTRGEIALVEDKYLHTIPYQPGDRVWVDRSKNTMPKDIVHPSTSRVQSIGAGWKQCGPFGRSYSDTVINWDKRRQRYYAARVCIDHPGAFSAHCGAWYTDST